MRGAVQNVRNRLVASDGLRREPIPPNVAHNASVLNEGLAASFLHGVDHHGRARRRILIDLAVQRVWCGRHVELVQGEGDAKDDIQRGNAPTTQFAVASREVPGRPYQLKLLRQLVFVHLVRIDVRLAQAAEPLAHTTVNSSRMVVDRGRAPPRPDPHRFVRRRGDAVQEIPCVRVARLTLPSVAHCVHEELHAQKRGGTRPHHLVSHALHERHWGPPAGRLSG
mmetsp:Transcript_123359/g.356552  ORF Transcript_123359/g.356552 Transcript_123359/m.356552 type:complete len:224 (+) Transcript_123359:347-1018(+)